MGGKEIDHPLPSHPTSISSYCICTTPSAPRPHTHHTHTHKSREVVGDRGPWVSDSSSDSQWVTVTDSMGESGSGSRARASAGVLFSKSGRRSHSSARARQSGCPDATGENATFDSSDGGSHAANSLDSHPAMPGHADIDASKTSLLVAKAELKDRVALLKAKQAKLEAAESALDPQKDTEQLSTWSSNARSRSATSWTPSSPFWMLWKARTAAAATSSVAAVLALENGGSRSQTPTGSRTGSRIQAKTLELERKEVELAAKRERLDAKMTVEKKTVSND